jgi:hypothetical protein
MIYGLQTIRTKKIDNYKIKCEHCWNYHQRFSIYQQYFHLMFIPFFPTGIKTIKCLCVDCNYALNQEGRKDYLELAKAPPYLYAGPILIVGLILFGLLANLNTQKQKREFVSHPRVGDVYQIRQDNHKSVAYYFLKVTNIKSDTVDLVHGALQYNGYVSDMNNDDYFVKDDIFRLLKSDLVHYLDSGYINTVERSYELNSRFNVEK